MAKIKTKKKTVRLRDTLKRMREKPEEVPVSVAVLSEGKKSEFWRVICQAIDANIAELQRDLRHPELIALPANEYKLRVELINGKINHLEQLKETPDNLIQSISEESEPEENPDPYKSKDE